MRHNHPELGSPSIARASNRFRGAPLDHPWRCQAHRQHDGQPCRAWAAQGQRVCLRHGGAAAQCKAAAQRRLDEAADRMAWQLLGIAETAESEAVKLAAVRDALNHVICRAPTTLDVSVGPRPWETVFDSIASGSRSESRAARGVPDDERPDAPEWVSAELEAARSAPLGAAVGAEVIDGETEPEPEPPPRRRYGPPPVTGYDAIAEAARCRALPELPPPRALPAARRR